MTEFVTINHHQVTYEPLSYTHSKVIHIRGKPILILARIVPIYAIHDTRTHIDKSHDPKSV